MIEINPSRWVQNPPPLPHQLTGVKALVTHKAFFLGDRPRTMKSRQVVDAACELYEAGEIDLVVVIARVAGRGVWGNAKLGQIKKWSWKGARVFEFHQKKRDLWSDPEREGLLTWVITNYDYIRGEKNLVEFMARLAANYKKALVVFDESHKLGNEHSQQAKAAMRICWNKNELKDQNGKVARVVWTARVARRVMLTGTPGNPAKHWSQFNILDHVFDGRYKAFKTFEWTFREYGEGVLRPVKGKDGKKGGLQLVHPKLGWKNFEKLSKITAPYALMRERKDCPGLKDVPVQSTFKEVRLSKETWKLYQSLKRDAIATLSTGEEYVTPNKGVCLQRLSQICNGHLGGFIEGETKRWLSNEKIEWLAEELTEDCLAENIIVWCRFIIQREHVAAKLKELGFEVYQIHGGQAKSERRIAEMIFTEGTVREPGKRYALVPQPQAGGDSNDFCAASDVYRASDVWGDWETFHQSNERPLGPGQKAAFVSSTDIVATGPDGQRTIDHTMLESRETGRVIENMSCSEWLTELRSE